MYKKYITKRGKKIGPYYYDSIRLKNGKIKTVYLGRTPPRSLQKQSIPSISSQKPVLEHHHQLYLLTLLVFVVIGFFFSVPIQEFPQEHESFLTKTSGGIRLTGFAVEELTQSLPTLSVTKNVDLVVSESSLYALRLPPDVALHSLSLTGTYSGDGKTSIYWNDKSNLIYSNVAEDKPLQGIQNALTGFFVSEEGTSFTVVDSKGKSWNPLLVLDPQTNTTTVTFTNAELTSLRFKDLQGTPLVYAESIIQKKDIPSDVTFEKVFALDTTALTFSEAEWRTTAQSPLLLLCRFWDATLEKCLGEWEKAKDLLPGEEYGTIITQGAFAWAEATPLITSSLLTGSVVTDTVDANITNETAIDSLEHSWNAFCTICKINLADIATLLIEVHKSTLHLSTLTAEVYSTTNASLNETDLSNALILTPLPLNTSRSSSLPPFKKSNFTNDDAVLTIIQRPLQIQDMNDDALERLTSPLAERGPNWLRVCESSRCTHDIYSRPIHMKDVDDKYKLVTDVVKVSKVDGDTFRVHWFDNEVNITLEGAQLLQTEVKTKGHGYEWIHHYNYTSPLDVPLIKVKANKEITEDGAGIIVDGVRIGFDDAEEQDFDVTPISIDTSTEAFLLQPETNKSIGETIEIDPTISLTTIAEDITTRNITNITSGTSTYDKTFGGTATFGIGIDGCTPDRFRRNRAYVDFDVSSLADNVIIEETNYSFGVRGLEDDNTAINITEMDGWGSNTGAEAAWTDAGGPIYVSMNLTPNTFYTFTLGASANARLQANLSSDQFTVGLRTGEVGSVTTCPTTETDRMAINASESTPSFITATYSLSPPEVTLNAPANNSAFTSVGAIVLNATIADRNDATIKEVVFYGTNGTAPSLTDILSINLGVTNGTQLTYNWTAPVIKNQTDTLLLFHFDNRSLFGENTTLVNDYSSNNYDGIAMGARFNWTITPFGGGYRFDGANDNITLGDQDAVIGFNKTYMFWVNVAATGGAANTRTIMAKYNSGASTGFVIEQGNDGIDVTGDSQTIIANTFFVASKNIHVAVTVNASGYTSIYRDGILHTTGSLASISANDNTVIFGEGTGTQDFNGFLDEFVIINRTLSAAEIMNSYRLPSGYYQWYANASDNSDSNTSLTHVFNLTIPTIPTITLNAPANNSAFTAVGAIVLNATVNDDNSTDLLNIELYGTNSSTITTEHLLYRAKRQSPGLTLAYNWTAPHILNQSNLLLLFHLDNNSAFGENSTQVYDFTGLDNIGTLAAIGAQIGHINETGGKIGGAYVSNGSGSITVNRINVGDKDKLIGLGNSKTYIAWVKPHVLQGLRAILSKYIEPPEPSTPEGFQIVQNGGSLVIYADGTARTISNFFTSMNVFVHMAVVVLANGTVDIYRDGNYFATTTISSITTNNEAFFVGRMSSVSTIQESPFNGTIDEVAIFNRSLTATEILNTYRLPGGTYFWRGNITDSEQNGNVSTMWMFTFNAAPTVSVGPTLTPAPANTTDQFTCAFTVHDDNGITGLSANISFYNNTRLAESYNISVTGDAASTRVATSTLQAHYENWTCGVTPFDGTTLGNQVNSSAVTVVNSPPTIPILLNPPNNNVTTVTTPFFNWSASTDPDNDMINYTLNITCLSTAGGSCPTGDDSQTINNINITNRTLTNDLDFFLDDGFRYNWTVRATDGSNASSFAVPFNLTLLVSIVLSNKATATIDFGTLSLGISSDTEEAFMEVPIVENLGNSLIVVNLSSNNFLFGTPTAPSSYFRFRVADPGGQAVVPFNTTESKTSNTNITVTNNTIALYDFNETAQANVHFAVTVPPDEPSGLKSARILMSAYYRGR